jgi:sugar lactone lactonase YvrE
VFRSGFSFITDITFGSDGSLYVLQFSSAPFPVGPGSIVRVTPSGTRSVVFAGLVTPTGLAIGRDGALYVSNCGVFPAGTDGPPPCAAGGGGHVLRIKP